MGNRGCCSRKIQGHGPVQGCLVRRLLTTDACITQTTNHTVTPLTCSSTSAVLACKHGIGMYVDTISWCCARGFYYDLALPPTLSMMTTFFRDGSPLFYGLCGGAAEPMGVVTKLRRRPSWNLCQLVRATRLRHQTSNLKPQS